MARANITNPESPGSGGGGIVQNATKSLKKYQKLKHFSSRTDNMHTEHIRVPEGDELRRITVMCLAVLAAFTVFATVRQDASSETYSQVVDNSDEERFATSKSWKKGNPGKGINGDDYLVARPSKKGAHALFEVAVPSDGEYAVYIRWPEVGGLNDSVPVGVETAYGTKWSRVDQSRDGGLWVRIGEFEMRKDEKFPVRISHDTRGKGNVAADAVKVEKISSYEEPSASRAGSVEPSEGTRAASAAGTNVGRTAISLANTFKNRGVTYKYGACTSTQMSCTCFTKKVFTRFGQTLPMDEPGQVRLGVAVASKSALRAGDLVYFKENGPGGPITHVGVYAGLNPQTGEQMLSHASSYFGTTVTSQMKYLRGYAGARRLV